MKKTFLILAIAVVSAFEFIGCAAKRNAVYNNTNQITINRKPKQLYNDVDKGLEVMVLLTKPQQEITEKPTIMHFSGKSFFRTPTIDYVRSMGLREKNAKTDNKLEITVVQADAYHTFAQGVDSNAGMCWVTINAVLLDPNGVELFSQHEISTTASGFWYYDRHDGLNEAYTQALEQINWNRIASYLRTEQQAKDEPQEQVQGLGNTALEQTIIRWDVQSRPQGADIFWRVVSTNPDVKSTNNKYLQTTPYEATKALDIKGLTYQTSGNVRIILRCEKDGYLPQEKEFDVRMVLDQEEISAFFRLVKDE